MNGEEKLREENQKLPRVVEVIFKLMIAEFKKDKTENKRNGLVLSLRRVGKVIKTLY